MFIRWQTGMKPEKSGRTFESDPFVKTWVLLNRGGSRNAPGNLISFLENRWYPHIVAISS